MMGNEIKPNYESDVSVFLAKGVMSIKAKEELIVEIERFKEESLKTHIVKVWADSYTNTNPFDYFIRDDGSIFWSKTQAYQLWSFWKASQVTVIPEGFVLVPRVITDDWMASYVDPAVNDCCKDYEGLPFSLDESDLPRIKESQRLPIRNAHKCLMQVIEAQEKGITT